MKIKNNLLTNLSGQLGEEFIVSSYRGETYLRRKPKTVSLSPKLIEQGERISAVAALWSAMKASGISRAWQLEAERTGLVAYNMVVQVCQKAFDGQGAISDFGKLRLCTGKLQLPDHIVLKHDKTGGFEISWEMNPGIFPHADETDILVVACMKSAKRFAIRIPDIGMFRRKDCRASFRQCELPEGFPHLFCYFRSEDGKRWSESIYLTPQPNLCCG